MALATNFRSDVKQNQNPLSTEAITYAYKTVVR